MTVFARLIGQDTLISVYDGGAFVIGTGPTYGSAIPVQAFAETITERSEGSVVDCRGMGDGYEQLRPTFIKNEIKIELRIENSGPVSVTLGGYGKVVYSPMTGVGTVTLQGIWTGDDFDSTMDQPQKQTLTLRGNADNV